MNLNLLYGPLWPRLRRAGSPEDPAIDPRVEGVWENLVYPDREALIDLARASRLGFGPTIRAHAERTGEPFVYVENSFVSLEMQGLIRPSAIAQDPVDSPWQLTARGEAVYRLSAEA